MPGVLGRTRFYPDVALEETRETRAVGGAEYAHTSAGVSMDAGSSASCGIASHTNTFGSI
jgi:hypothetical protein